MNWAAIIWAGLLVAFLVTEAICAVHLVSIWFAAGALCAMVVAFLTGPVWLQVCVFLVVSCALLALLWPLTRKFLNPHVSATNVDAVLKALVAFGDVKPIILLGGRDKGTDLEPLIAACAQSAKAVVLFGESRDRFDASFTANISPG